MERKVWFARAWKVKSGSPTAPMISMMRLFWMSSSIHTEIATSCGAFYATRQDTTRGEHINTQGPCAFSEDHSKAERVHNRTVPHIPRGQPRPPESRA